MNYADQLLQLRLQRPFVPFRVTLTNGSTITVTERLKFAVNGIIMIALPEHGPSIKFRIEQVASIEMLEPVG